MSDVLVEAVLLRWEQWDRQPGRVDVAQRMEEACAALAAEVGMSCTQLRDRLCSLRRDGASYDEALAEVTGNH
jgi:hypothetical protein